MAVFLLFQKFLQQRILEGVFFSRKGFLLGEDVVGVGKKSLGHSKDTVGNEKGGKDVDGIVEVAENYPESEESGGSEAEVAHPALIPVNEGEEVGDAGMTGEEIVTAVGQGAKDIVGIKVGVSGEWSQVGKDDKRGTNENEEGHAFQNKRNASWLPYDEEKHEEAVEGGHIIDNPFHVHDGDVIEQEVADRIAGLGGGV